MRQYAGLGASLVVTALPDEGLARDWDRIYLADKQKEQALGFLNAIEKLRAAAAAFDSRRTLLFYGPPGTGKSSIARGLANQWAKTTRSKSVLASVNTHAIPSGEHGQTQKNVVRLFQGIVELAERHDRVFAHVDELETVGSDRAQIGGQTNPLDALNAVNAFLEETDRVSRSYSNVVFLFTSNLLDRVDRALRDRVDFAVHVGLPGRGNRELILREVVDELSRVLACHVEADSDTWHRLLSTTKGFSGRQLRHVGLRALTLLDEGEALSLAHVLEAAKTIARERASMNGGLKRD